MFRPHCLWSNFANCRGPGPVPRRPRQHYLTRQVFLSNLSVFFFILSKRFHRLVPDFCTKLANMLKKTINTRNLTFQNQYCRSAIIFEDWKTKRMPEYHWYQELTAGTDKGGLRRTVSWETGDEGYFLLFPSHDTPHTSIYSRTQFPLAPQTHK